MREGRPISPVPRIPHNSCRSTDLRERDVTTVCATQRDFLPKRKGQGVSGETMMSQWGNLTHITSARWPRVTQRVTSHGSWLCP